MHSRSTRSLTIGRWRVGAAAALLTLLALVAGLLTPFPAAAHAVAVAPTATTATVSGTITSTQNPGVGAANVQISLRETDESGYFTPLTKTDAAGHYTLNFPGSGTTQLVIGATRSGSLPYGPYESLFVSVSYTAGEATTGVDFLVRYMPTLLVVATYDDAARTPVDRVAHITGQDSYRIQSLNTGTTGALFTRLLSGQSYRVDDRTGIGIGFPAKILTMGTQDITLNVLVSASERGSVVSVTVGTDDGTSQPVAVTLTGVGQSARAYTATPVSGSTTDYSFPNVVPGTYQLRAAPTNTAYPATWYADSYTAAEATTVTVGPAGSPLDLALTIHKALTLTLPDRPVITGNATLDGTLTATTSGWGPAPVTLSYSWLRNGQAIPGATAATYRVTGSDLGVPLSVSVTAAKPGYASASKVSASVTPPPGFVTAPTPVIPQPAITGTILTATVGTWSPTPTSFVYAWYRDGVAIPGATTVTHRLVTADSGTRITFSATAARGGFTSLTRTSAPTEVVAYRFTASALPKISGPAAVGRTLTASTGSVTPAPTTYAYQWLRNGAAIAGATAASYVLHANDEGAAVSVRVTATRAGYQSLVQTSAATAAVLKGFTTTPTPAIIGAATVGVTLVASTPSWRPLPVQLSFRWTVGGVDVPDIGGTIYKIAPADVGKTITLTVTGTAAGYLTESRTSVATRPVVGGFTAAPTPKITGTPKVGQTLTADATGWLPAHVAIAYQWLRNGTPIAGATAKTYRLTSADAGKRIIVQVTGTKAGYATQTKQSLSVVAAP